MGPLCHWFILKVGDTALSNTFLMCVTDGPVDVVVNEIAKKHNKTPDQILLRWNLQKGHIVITTSSKEERLRQYLDIYNFSLSEEEEKQIDVECAKREFRKFWSNKEW